MNFNDPAVLAVGENVAKSIQIIFDTNSTGEQRRNATVFCEDFRTRASSLELCSVGFAFVSKFQHSKAAAFESQLALVGLQFVEDVVKFRWPQFEERILVKNHIIHMMKTGLSPDPDRVDEIPHYLHEMIARIIVEIAKREWPQFWPDLFPTLLGLLPTSDLPLLILRRMAEDVFILQRVDSVNRRKDLSQCLHVVCQEVLESLFGALRNSLSQFQSSDSEALNRRIKTILETIQPFVEWSKISCFTCGDRMKTLFNLLLNEKFRFEAADCIIELVERKTIRKEERYDIPNSCLNPDAFTFFLNAVIFCQAKDEEFVKKLGNILTALCSHSLGVEESGARNVMKGIVTMASRCEATAVLSAILGTSSFIKMMTFEIANAKDWPKSLLTQVVELIVKKCTSPPVNSERRETIRIRQEFPMLLRKIGKVLPDLYFFISTWLRQSLSDPSKIEAYQWDALIMVMGSVQSYVNEENRAIVELGLEDLEICFTRFAVEPNLKTKSFILSTVSALFVFLSISKNRSELSQQNSKLLHSILEGIFSCFPHNQISQHAASLIVKLSADFPELMLPNFDAICSCTIKLMPSIKHSEFQRLVEALVLLSNQWDDPVKQSAFIVQLINSQHWQHIAEISKNPQHFVQMFQDESLFVRERLVLNNLNLCYGIIRRAKLKTDKSNDQASATAVHPVMNHFVPVISASLDFINTIHSLVQIPELKFIMDISNSEMCQLMGITQWSTEAEMKLVNAHLEPLIQDSNHKTGEVDLKLKFQDLIKKFVRASLESAYGIVGHSFADFSPDIFSVPHIGEMVLHCGVGNAHLLDDYRVYVITRYLLKPFLLSCPATSVDTVVKPFLQNFLPFMLERFQTRWNAISNDDSESDIKEVLESCALRVLTKEFLEIMQLLLGYSKSQKPVNSSGEHDGMGEDTSDAEMEIAMDGEAAAETQNLQYVQAGAMNVLLEDNVCSRTLLHLCLLALTWNDKLVNLRATRCLVQYWPVIAKDPQILHAVFVESLRGILVLDDPETRDVLQKILLLICSASLENDPAIAQILLEWGARESDVKKLLAVIQSGNTTTGRSRKDCLRKMVRNNPNVQSTKGAREKWLNNLPKVTIYNLAERIEQSVSLNECSTEIHQ